MHGLVQKILETCERVANIFLQPGTNYTFMYNLHTLCKWAHVNGASVVTRNAHAKYEYPASPVSKVLSDIYVVRYVGQRSLGKNIGTNRKAFRGSLVTVNLFFLDLQ